MRNLNDKILDTLYKEATISEEEKELIRKNWMKNGRAGRVNRD